MSKKASKRVAAAYRTSVKGGNYGAAIAAKQAQAAERAMGAAFGAAMAAAPRKSEAEYGRAWGAAKGGKFGSGFGKRAKHALSSAEKKARAAVKAAITNVARAARLPGKGKGKVKGKRAAAAAPASRRRTSKVPTVTAQQVLKQAESKALKRWACEGARRSGCGAGGSRVVNHPRGGLVRIRPPRVLSAG